ncbi:hypothetical protein DMB37_27630 [Nocardia sp. CS682]|nr:hypothetical protein DMB37_27630 [Nocardia sp. CS682]
MSIDFRLPYPTHPIGVGGIRSAPEEAGTGGGGGSPGKRGGNSGTGGSGPGAGGGGPGAGGGSGAAGGDSGTEGGSSGFAGGGPGSAGTGSGRGPCSCWPGRPCSCAMHTQRPSGPRIHSATMPSCEQSSPMRCTFCPCGTHAHSPPRRSHCATMPPAEQSSPILRAGCGTTGDGGPGLTRVGDGVVRPVVDGLAEVVADGDLSSFESSPDRSSIPTATTSTRTAAITAAITRPRLSAPLPPSGS